MFRCCFFFSSAQDERRRLEVAVEPALVRLQALARGFLVRERLAMRLAHFHDNVDAIVRIQAWWRRIVQRRRFLQLVRAPHFQCRRGRNQHIRFYSSSPSPSPTSILFSIPLFIRFESDDYRFRLSGAHFLMSQPR